MSFVHCHVHSTYSFLDGYCKIPNLVNRVKELGQNSVAITDHNHLGSAYPFKQECEKQDIKPLLGCCLPNQLIYTSTGMKEIQDIQVGDMVLTHTGEYKPVTRHWSRKFSGELYGIKSWNSNTVWLTDEHPVLVKHNQSEGKMFCRKWSSKLQWIRADELRQKRLIKTAHDKKEFVRIWENYTTFPKHKKNGIDSIHVLDFLPDGYEQVDNVIQKKDAPYYYQVKTFIPADIVLTEDLMKFFGLFVAEGSYQKQGNGNLASVCMSFNSSETDLHNFVIDCAKRIFYTNGNAYNRESYGRNSTEILLFSVTLANLLYSLFGEGAHDKKIPVWFLGLSDNLQKAFLNGLELGDAKITPKRIILKLANKKLIYQLKAMLANLGVSSSVSEVIQYKNERPYIAWSLDYSYDLQKGMYYHSDELYVYTPLRQHISIKPYEGLVYNFTVQDDNSYVTDIILHNCELYYTPSIPEMMKPVSQRNAEAEEVAIALGFHTREEINKMKKEELKVVHKKYGYDMNDFHILFIAKSQKGWHNLVKIQSESARLCTFNGRYHCDMNLLEKYSEDVICTTACVGGFSQQQIELGNYDVAEEYIKNMKQIFGENFYLEIQPLNQKLQRAVNIKYLEWSRKYEIPIVATNDSHWVLRDDAADHDVLLCIGIGKSVADPARMHYAPEFWVRSEEEMLTAFETQTNEMLNHGELEEDDLSDYVTFYEKALSNTQYLADSVDSDIKLGAPKPMFPVVKVPKGQTPESVLTHMAYSGLHKYLKKHPELDKFKYVTRLKEELDVINPKGFAPYMLTVQEYINWCDSNKIPTGPGRGSAAGSLVLFCIGITKNIDPIKDKLLFGRFLTKDRKDLPDIDCDVSNVHREDVVKHLEDYYGKINVAHVGTYGTLKVKSACKDVARVLDIPFADSLKISKELDAIDTDPNLSFKMIDGWETSGEPGDYDKWKRFKKLEEANQMVFSYARKFEGIPRQLGVHASAILVTPEPVDDWVPLFYKDNTAVTLYTGPQVEACNFVKLDLLGLKTLDVIDLALKYINPNITLESFYDKVDRNDPKIFKMISKKQTDGLFQIESDMMKGLVGKIQPTEFHDLSALISIGRPGPLSAHADDIYANGKNGKELAPCPLRGCENIFKDTYNAIIYQESLMHVSKQIAGFDDTQADSITRKTVAKKRKEMMPLMLRCHIYGKRNIEGPPGWEDDMHAPWYDPKGKYGGEIEGAIAHGYTEQEVLDYFKSIEAFSSYALKK